jgi:hypothetical protein
VNLRDQIRRTRRNATQEVIWAAQAAPTEVSVHEAAADPHPGYVQESLLNELVDDRVAALLVAGANVTLTYNDGANTLTIASSGGGGGGGNGYMPGGW